MRLITKLLSLCFLVGLLAACSSDNLEKPAALVEFTPKIHVEKVWSRSVSGTDDEYVNLAIGHDANTVYTVGHDGEVYAIDAITGKIRWRKKLYSNIISGIAVGDQLAVVGTAAGSVIAMDTNTGEVLWEQFLGNQTLGLAGIGQNKVVVKTVDGVLIALDASTGNKLWQYAGDVPQLILRGGSQPQVLSNNLIVGFANGKVGKLSVNAGAPQWLQAIADPSGSFAVQRMIDITASPIISAGVVYATAYQGNIAALELASGQVIWNHKLSSYTGMALDASGLYATDAKSYVWKFQTDTGGVAWRQTALEARIISSPALLNDYLIVGDGQGYLHWLSNTNGEFVAREKLSSDAIRTAPVVIGNMLYVLDVDGDLAAYRVS